MIKRLSVSFEQQLRIQVRTGVLHFNIKRWPMKEHRQKISRTCSMSKGIINQVTLSATESPLKGKGIRASVAFQVTTAMITRSTVCRYTHIWPRVGLIYCSAVVCFSSTWFSLFRPFSLAMGQCLNSRPRYHHLKISSYTTSCVVRQLSFCLCAAFPKFACQQIHATHSHFLLPWLHP